MSTEDHVGPPHELERDILTPSVGLARGGRIALEVLGPPALGAVVVYLPSMLWEIFGPGKTMRADFSELGSRFPFYLMGAYTIALIPSVVFTAVIECVFACGLSPRSWRTVGLTTALGTIAGLGISVIVTDRPTTPARWKIIGILTGIGVIVGFLLGVIIRWRSKPRAPAKASASA